MKSLKPHARIARVSIMQQMAPLLLEAGRTQSLIVSRYDSSVSFTPIQLRNEWAKGKYIWGPNHWRLCRQG